MKPYYELHITIRADDEDAAGSVERVVTSMGWLFSRIDGDPELGSGVRCYATLHMNKRHSRHEVLSRLLGGRQHLFMAGCEVERIKIEEVIFDRRGSSIERDVYEPVLHRANSVGVSLETALQTLEEEVRENRLANFDAALQDVRTIIAEDYVRRDEAYP